MSENPISVATGLLFGLLLVAAVTDWRRGVIYNWTVYPGIVLAIVGNAIADYADCPQASRDMLGLIGLDESFWGFMSCGGVMLICYVFFPGGVGGGDIKLIAMIGAFMGLDQGLRAMLWTFVLGGCLALIVLVWREGLLNLLSRIGKTLLLVVRYRTAPSLSEEQREPLKTNLPLAIAAVAAVLIVHFDLVLWF